MRLIGGLFFLLWAALVVLVPVLGVWLASSLVAFHGGPAALAVIGGALLFPVLPVFWEVRATQAFKRRASRPRFGVSPRRTLTLRSRLILRTLTLNVLFLAGLALGFPEQAFPALATRGDWFLDGKNGAGVDLFRRDVLAAASGLEWLYQLAHENPYKRAGDTLPTPDNVKPVAEATFMPAPTARRWIPGTAAWAHGPAPQPEPEKLHGSDGDETPRPLPPPVAPLADELTAATYTVGDTRWPWKDVPAASVRNLTAQDELSIDSVGHAIAAHEPDDFHRVKALHDWVVTRLTYDKATAGSRTNRAPQDAASVFASRTGVCEGYARLLVALGQVTGDRIVYLTGDVREKTGEAAPVGHAWNAVELRGSWYLIDATWDDPSMDDGTAAYGTDYLFIPPSLAVFDHFPDEPRWQLLATPLGRGDFLRQPLARPSLAREGLTLVAPERSTVEVDGPLTVELANPKRLFVMASVMGTGGAKIHCGDPTNDSKPRLACEVPPGVSSVILFGNARRDGTYHDIAAFRVTRR